MAASDPLIGRKLGDYEIQSVLGVGGMARVYLGYDDKLDRHAAVKVIEPQLIASADENEYRERFLKEARAIARLNHPHIVGVYQFGQVDNLYYIAMAYVEGRNLREILKEYIRQGQLISPKEMLVILRDIADALDFAHKNNIIHRDVKPSNFIIKDSGNAILTDFGLALNAVEGTIGNTFGSVHYIAPEQAISSAQAVPASDQYSLAVVAFELMTGRVPFDDASAMSVALKHISDPAPNITDVNPGLPVAVEQVMLRAMDKDFSKRYGSCREFVNALESAFSSAANDAEAPSMPKRERVITQALKPANPIPAPVPLSEDSPTIGTGSRATVPLEMQDKSNNRLNTGLLALGVVIGLVLVALLLLMQANNNQSQQATQTAVADLNLALLLTGTRQAEIRLTENSIAQTAIAQAYASETAQATLSQIAPSATPTDEPSATPTDEPSATPTDEPSATPTDEPSATPTDEPSATPTDEATATLTQTRVPTRQAQVLPTLEPSATATDEPTATLTYTPEPSATATDEPTATQTYTPEPSATATDEPTATQTYTPEPSATATDEPTATQTQTRVPTRPAQVQPSATNTNTPEPTATHTPEPSATHTNTPEPTSTNTNTPEPTLTVTPSVTPTPQIQAQDGDTAQVLLRYDGDSLVVYNRSSADVRISNLLFILQVPDRSEGASAGAQVEYRLNLSELGVESLRPETCVHVWRSEFTQLPIEDPPADICRSRLGYRTLAPLKTFWIAPTPDDVSLTFEVRRGEVDLLTRCPVNKVDTTVELRCVLDVNAAPLNP